MHGDILSPDAGYYRMQYYRAVAHRRLVVQARTTSNRQIATELRARLGRVLLAGGTHRWRAAPPATDPASVAEPAPGTQPGR